MYLIYKIYDIHIDRYFIVKLTFFYTFITVTLIAMTAATLAMNTRRVNITFCADIL